MNLLCAAVVLALAGCGSATSTSSNERTASVAAAAEYSPTLLDDVLHAYVDANGRVNYRQLKQNRAGLDQFITSLGGLDLEMTRSWPDARRIAFWINAYNAITLQRIIDHYPIQRGGILDAIRYPQNSIRQIDGVWTTITTRVAGQNMTLDHIEHDILRKEFREPRIHAALVCAAKGCPPLRNEIFAPDKLDAQLDDQSRRFLDDAHRFQVDRDKKIVRLSPILKWYGQDFKGVYNPKSEIKGHSPAEDAALEFASHYVGDDDAKFIREAAYRVEFMDYDWSLNEQE